MSNQPSKPTEPGGFAHLPKQLLKVWPSLPEHHLRLLPLLLSFASDSRPCFPSQTKLAKLAAVSRQSINAAIGELPDAGLLVVTHRTNEKGQNTSAGYQLARLDDETVISAVRGDTAKLVSESADLLYHWLVVLAIAGVPLSDVLAELDRRTGRSGIAEKAARRDRD